VKESSQSLAPCSFGNLNLPELRAMEEQTMWSVLVKFVKNPFVRKVALAVLNLVIDDLMKGSKNKKRS
jgi:hypothetical protein